jgi:hypothetical protein
VIEEQGGSEGVTNEDLQKDIKDLHKLTEGMSARLDDGVKQVYQNRLVSFDNAIRALAIDCGQAERMFKKADALAKERGLLDLPKSDVPPVPEMPGLPEMPAELAQDVVLPDEPAVREISFANHIASPYDVKNLLLSGARNYRVTPTHRARASPSPTKRWPRSWPCATRLSPSTSRPRPTGRLSATVL